MLASIAVLLIALMLQVVIANRESLAKNVTFRPLLNELCVFAHCQLSVWQQPEAFQPIQFSVTADSIQNGLLMVQLSFKNTAEWPQPWPLIELTFTNISGQKMGLRRFHPNEYLNSAHAPNINAGQSVSVELAIQETTGKAEGFQFNFY